LGGGKILKSAYNHQMGRLAAEEMEIFLKQASRQARMESASEAEGLAVNGAQAESRRCLHCDCRKADRCRLRDLATEFGAQRNVWPTDKTLFEQITACENVIYEPGKCIKCGLCVQTAEKAGEQIGLSFEGRGFEMKIAVPLQKALDEGLQKAATDCVKICPTGALSLKEMIT
jgi:predicted molibdopterin-dependent oxidoreductase YjgC